MGSIIRSVTLYCSVAAVLLAQGKGDATGQEAPSTREIEYNRDIRPLLSDKCFRCHGPDAAHREADLRLDLRQHATASRNGTAAIVPGKSSESELVRRITAQDDQRMPPPDSGSVLAESEIELLREWIDQGASYQQHWAFLLPQAQSPPAVRDTAWPRSEIDYFVLAELERRGLQPSPEASRETWLRRVSLDLIGLPPTLAEIDTFLADTSPRAYDRVVERLLESPHYGERMAIDWLDAARYADTNGYFTDAERTAWPWRDWVINSFNANMPFDQFTVEQLAGDLLPDANQDQLVATGFNRNHMANNETGIIDEEFRTSYVADRVDTTTTVWLGLTVACARCHDHKYDPVSQREYYELFAFFNTIEEAGLLKDAAPRSPSPAISLPTPRQQRELERLRSERSEAEKRWDHLKPVVNQALETWERGALESLAPIPAAGCTAWFDFQRRSDGQGDAKVNATLNGALRYSAGAKGLAANFDATQSIEFTVAEPLERDRPFALALWVKPASGQTGCLISKMDSSADCRGLDIVWYKSQPRIHLVHAWGHDAIEITVDHTFATNRWQHLAVSYDGSGKAAGLQVFVDGKAAAVLVRRDHLSGSIATDEPWRIGWKATGQGFEGSIDELRLFGRSLTARDVEAIYVRELLEGAIGTPSAERTGQQREQLEEYYIAHHGSQELRMARSQLASLRSQEALATASIASASVMQEMDQPRATHLLVRGQYDQPGEQVQPGVPAALGLMPAELPRNRLGLARWLTSRDNPLTARVTVNRYWQQLFGEGLVRTPNDFGAQGQLPTHPQLLDWLAVRFMQSGWNTKELLKLLVTSTTYRQSSNFTAGLLETDPENRLLARGPRYRLPAELIRDQALAMSGLLSRRIGGPSVKPYQPPGLWEAVSYDGNQSYQADQGESLYRRGLYTFWKRQSPPPDMLIFDGPTREICTVRRPRTNTPLQALLLMNDVAYVEAARSLATRILREGGSDVVARVRHGFRLVTGRVPQASEVEALKRFVQQQRSVFARSNRAARELIEIGDTAADPALDSGELAAWTMAASVLLNLDEVVTQH